MDGGRSGTAGLFGELGKDGGSALVNRLSWDISIEAREAVDISSSWVASLPSTRRGLECRLVGLSERWSDLKETGDREPSWRLRLQDRSLVGEADMPDMSLVRLDTRADVSDWEPAEFCRARPGASRLPMLTTLADSWLGTGLRGTPRPWPMEMGLELLERLKARAPCTGPGAGDADRDFLGVPGVPGGVTPFPFALLAPITLTSSFTETPCSSGGRSLLNASGFL
jgi:hypothetical protein